MRNRERWCSAFEKEGKQEGNEKKKENNGKRKGECACDVPLPSTATMGNDENVVHALSVPSLHVLFPSLSRCIRDSVIMYIDDRDDVDNRPPPRTVDTLTETSLSSQILFVSHKRQNTKLFYGHSIINCLNPRY